MSKIRIGKRKLMTSTNGKILNIPNVVLKQIPTKQQKEVEIFFDTEEQKLEIFFKNID